MLGYMCETHGYQDECDVDETGERTCYECGMAVTGLGGRARSTYYSPPEGENLASGDIEWVVVLDHGGRSFSVWAFGYLQAIESALEEVDNPQQISEVFPAVDRYRA